MTDQASVSFALFAYNQEEFVEAAVKAALAQDYDPLEILISDDASTDRTFEIIQSVVATYQGDHRVSINRNPQNLGVARHVNRVMELTSGDIVVVAAADDISLPHRVTETVRAFRDAGKDRVYSVCSSVELIDDEGKTIGKREIADPPDVMEALCTGRRWITGCSHAWDRALFDVFGPLKDDVHAEDKVIGFRAMLLGGRVAYIDKDLVLYRQHEQSVSSASFVFRRSHMLLASALSYEADLETLVDSGANIEHLDVDALREQIRKLLTRARAYVRIADSGLVGGVFAWLANVRVVTPRVAMVMLGAKIAGKRRNRRMPGAQA